MKNRLILALCLTAFTVTSCTEDPPPRRRTTYTRHVYREREPSVSTPTNEGSDNFHAVTKPDTYSGQ